MIRRISASIREYKKNAILSALFGVGEAAFEVLIPYFMAFMVNRGISASNMSETMKFGLILIAMSFLALLFGSFAGINSAKASVGFAKNLRGDMFDKVQEFSFGNIDKFSTPSIVTRLTTDVTNVQNAFQSMIRLAIRTPLMIIFAMVMAFNTSRDLSLIFVGAIPIMSIGLILIIRKVYPVFTRIFATYDSLNQVVQENLHGIRVVKSFVREDHEIGKFKKISSKIFTDFAMAERTAALIMPLFQLCLTGVILLISWFSAKLIVSSGATLMNTGDLLGLISYTFQILINLIMFAMVLVSIAIAKTSGERISELLVEEVNLKNNDNAIDNVANGDIAFDNVSFSYSGDSDKLCLLDVSLAIKSGETVGIIGSTGSSKSTLVQLIPRIYDATIGSVKVAGIDVRDYDIETLRNSVAMVLQKNVLFSGTIEENLRWGNPDATDDQLVEACTLAQADSFISKLEQGYKSPVEQGGVNFSGGQQQRLCIARALLKNPKILILDDSTSAVDTKTDSLIRAAMYEKIPHTTKLIIAQRVSSVENADKIVIMDNGRISAIGTHDELLAHNVMYKGLYDSQLKGGDKLEEEQ